MGMYTEFHFNARLKENVPEEAVEVLRFMVGDAKKPAVLPNHPLFETRRWEHMLRMDSASFDADTISTLRYDNLHEDYYLCIRCNLKNYDNEIQKFVDWVRPYLKKQPGHFLGFYRYEEDETKPPVLIFM